MPGLDELLTRDLSRLSPPVDVSPDLVREVDRRRRKRHTRRLVGNACLAAIVVAAGSIGGFVALQRAFNGEGSRPAVTPTPAPRPDMSASLQGDWTITSYIDLNGTLVEPAVGTTLNFSSGSYGIDARCNLLGGRFNADGSAITFSEGVRHDTRCSAGALAKEEVLIQAVTTATTFEIEADTLTLFDRVDDAAVTLTREGNPCLVTTSGRRSRICSSEQLGIFLGEGLVPCGSAHASGETAARCLRSAHHRCSRCGRGR